MRTHVCARRGNVFGLGGGGESRSRCTRVCAHTCVRTRVRPRENVLGNLGNAPPWKRLTVSTATVRTLGQKTFPRRHPHQNGSHKTFRRGHPCVDVETFVRCAHVETFLDASTWKRTQWSVPCADVETFILERTFQRVAVSTSTPTTPVKSTWVPTWKRLTWKRFVPKGSTWKRFDFPGERSHVEKVPKRFDVQRGNVFGVRRRGNVSTWKRFTLKRSKNVSTCKQMLGRGNVFHSAGTWKRFRHPTRFHVGKHVTIVECDPVETFVPRGNVLQNAWTWKRFCGSKTFPRRGVSQELPN